MANELKKSPRVRLAGERARPAGKAVRLRTGQTRIVIRKTSQPTADQYVPTPEEQTAVQKYNERTAAASAVPRLKAVDGMTITVDHPNQEIGLKVLAEALGVQDINIALQLIAQVADLTSHGYNIQQHELNFILSLLKGLAPKDNMQAMVATHMVAIHQSSMLVGQRLALSVKTPEQVTLAHTLSKLARTFVDLVEAFNRCRACGDGVAVQNVLVGQGGQAIVSNVGPAVGKTACDKAAMPTPQPDGSQNPVANRRKRKP